MVYTIIDIHNPQTGGSKIHIQTFSKNIDIEKFLKSLIFKYFLN
jgi:hypothetical protein